MSDPKVEAPVALVHDYLLVLRGAERTFAEMTEVWPSAPIYTLLYDEAGTSGRFADRSVIPSALQHLRVGQPRFRQLLPLYQNAVKRLPVSSHSVIVSSSSAFPWCPARARCQARLLLPLTVSLRLARA